MSTVIRCLSLRIRMSDRPAWESFPMMCARILMSSIRYPGNSFLPVYQFDFQSWITPTRIPPGWIFWPISGHLSSESCAPGVKRPARKDAGSVRSRRLRARLRTQRAGALQRPGVCEAGGRGPPSTRSTRFLLARRGCRRFLRRRRFLLRLRSLVRCRRFLPRLSRRRRCRQLLQLHRDVARPLADLRNATARACTPALHRRPFVRVRRRHEHVVADELVIRLCVRGRGVQHLLDVARDSARGKREDRARLRDGATADQVGDETRLSRRGVHKLRLGLHLAPCAVPAVRAHVLRFTSVLRSPEWPRNVRVGANSPSLCPTICSEMKTGTCLRPSCTAIVCPTISGKIVEVRDHVRTIRFSFFAFMSSIRLISRSWTKGPFFELRLI